jgi:hypothetical protein
VPGVAPDLPSKDLPAMNLLERLILEPRGGMYRELEGLTTHFPPRDLALYRKLLPKPFEVAGAPIVTIFVADYLRVVPWPATRYQEWSILLKSAWNGEEGWYCVTMGVTKWRAMAGGRYFGFPKYVADEITLTTKDETCSASAKYKARTQLALEFSPGVARPLTEWESELLTDVSFFKGSIHLLVPPGRGPRAQKATLRHVTEPKWSPKQGMVLMRVDPGESWANLVPDDGPFPGTYNHFVGGANIFIERLN